MLKTTKKLTQNKGIFRLSCGYWNGADNGPRRPKVHLLGRDESEAEITAEAIKVTWDTHVRLSLQDGVPRDQIIWDEVTLAQAHERAETVLGHKIGEGLRLPRLLYRPATGREDQPQRNDDGTMSVPAHPPDGDYSFSAYGGVGPATGQPVDTIEEGAKLYFDWLQNERHVGRGHLIRQKETMGQVYSTLPKDSLIVSLTQQEVGRVVGHFVGRPQTGLGEPMAVDGVRSVLGNFKRFLGFLEKRGHWDAPKHWQSIFEINYQRLFTPQELRRKAEGVDTFTPAELKTLWKHATDREKMLMLFGLQFCATQQQLAQLVREDVHLDGDPAYVDYFRGKTQVYCSVNLWPVTLPYVAKALGDSPIKDNPKHLLLLTEDGKELVNFSENENKSDSVKQAWNRLLNRCKDELPEDRRLSFSALRDTTSTAVLLRSNDSVQEQILAHGQRTLGRKRYTGKLPREKFAEMNVAMRRWYDEELADVLKS